ncbi:MAG: GNAT family N-acetyltransferase [Pseudomonadota bacterium]
MLGGKEPMFAKPQAEYLKLQSSDLRLVAYSRVEDVPMEDARALLTAHVNWAYDQIRALGAPDFDAMAHVARFFEHFDDVLPPKGAYFLVHDRDGCPVGTGSLRSISSETGEMKHLYVRPEMRGRGLGEALISARISAARELGLRTLVADTFRGNGPMIHLYHRHGFTDTAPYDCLAAKITPELGPHLRYFQMAL